MKIKTSLVLSLWIALCALVNAEAGGKRPKPPVDSSQKEWLFLVYLNGHNNLDPYGAEDINEMEKVGSTENIHVVVQWASLANPKTKRVYVKKDSDENQVTSPVIESLPRVDMGDSQSLVEFIDWAYKKYPAKKIFVNVWNHGSGWHRLKMRGDVQVKDISFDETTGNVITTQQLGTALGLASQKVGKKIDLYGSDACLMGMIEVAQELAASTRVMVGAQELEPGDGWPYDRFLRQWSQNSKASPAEVAQVLVREYVSSYRDGAPSERAEVTLSAVDLEKVTQLSDSMREFSQSLRDLTPSEKAEVVRVFSEAQGFNYPDYKDLGDFLTLLEGNSAVGIRSELISSLQSQLQASVIANEVTSRYVRAQGLSIWFPDTLRTFQIYRSQYEQLEFDARSEWGSFLQTAPFPGP